MTHAGSIPHHLLATENSSQHAVIEMGNKGKRISKIQNDTSRLGEDRQLYLSKYQTFGILSIVVSVLLSISSCARLTSGPGNGEGGGATPLMITTPSLPNFQVSHPYSARLIASGGQTPYTWGLTSSSNPLPAGLTLAAATGTITGTPATPGAYWLAIQVFDSSSPKHTAVQTYVFSANGGENGGAGGSAPLTITTPSLPNFQVSQPYSASLTASGGQSPYTWELASSSKSLPPGLTLALLTGAITGTPATPGNYPVTIQVSDSSSPEHTATQTYALSNIISGISLDQYGGREDIKCASATGSFHTEKIGNQWWFCTPLGNAFFMQGVYTVDYSIDSGYQAKVQSKYGNTPANWLAAWADNTNRRLASWGFNTLGVYAGPGVVPTSTDSSYPVDIYGLHSLPTKLPFITTIRPALDSMRNVHVSTLSGDQILLSEPVKNMLYGISPYYTGFDPQPGVADYFDGKMDQWLAKDLAVQKWWNTLENSPYLPYLIGIGADDGDEMYGFGAGDAIPTIPPSNNNAHLVWVITTMSPVQTANSIYQAIYSDSLVYTKKAWRDFLAAKYGSVSALNAAWGSNYTAFDSSGTQVTGESVATGDGSALSFSHTLAKLTPSAFSVQVFVNGVAVGGDIGNGSIYGPNLARTSTINYSSGVLNLNFTSGNAPAVGVTITVSYMQNGWGIGTGLMDEDGRPAHQVWLSGDAVYLTGANSNVKADMDAFLYQVASQYLSVCSTELKKVFPNTLFLGPDSIGSWGSPARAEVLQAAAAYVDVLSGSNNIDINPGALDYTAQYYGDKPMLEGQFLSAGRDSPWATYAKPTEFPTQHARGQAYYNTVTALPGRTVTATGSRPFIGTSWWQFTDDRSQKKNWGLVTLIDNAYDGQESVTAHLPCAAPLQQFMCGGELSTYGDAISLISDGNQFWLTH